MPRVQAAARALLPCVWWLAAVVASAVVGLLQLCWPVPVAPPGAMVDDVQYLEIAAAIRDGHYAIAQMLPHAVPELHFPPVFPLWLVVVDGIGRMLGLPAWSPVGLLWGQRVLAVVGVGLWVLVAGMWVEAAWSRGLTERMRRMSASMAAGGVALAAALPISRLLAGTLLSEPLAALWVAGAYLCVRGLVDQLTMRSCESSRLRAAFVIACGVLGAGVLVRTAWAPVVIALLVGECWRLLGQGRSKVARPLALAGVFVGLLSTAGWALWGAAVVADVPSALGSGYGPYAQFLAEGLARPDGLRGLLLLQATQVLRFSTGLFWWWGIGVAAFVAMGVGAWKVPVAGRFAVLAVFGVLVMLALWPFFPDRFLIAYAPFAAVLIALGLTAIIAAPAARRVTSRDWAVVGGVLGMVIAVPLLRHTMRGYGDGSFGAAIQAQFGDAIGPVRWAETAPDSLAPYFSKADHLVRWYAHKPSLPLPPFRGDWFGRTPSPGEMAVVMAETLCLVPHGTVLYAPSDVEMRAAVAYLAALTRNRVRIGPLVIVSDHVAYQRVRCADPLVPAARGEAVISLRFGTDDVESPLD